MGTRLDALSELEKAAVTDYVRAEYDKLIFQHPTDYVTRNAQADPEAWQKALRDMITSNRDRVEDITRAAQRKLNKSSHGFTLIELSIVLVIIGLIVGGVLVGQDLIRAAGVRATIAQIEKYNTAANTFRGKYGFLPGDIKDPDASSFGLAARGQYAGEGDGNGVIEGINTDSAGTNWGLYTMGETDMFWVDLSKVKMLDGTFTLATPNTFPSGYPTPVVGNYYPAAQIGNQN